MPDVIFQPESHAFVVRDGDDVVGRLAYHQHGDVLDAYTTWVRPDRRGRGEAAALVEALLDHARREGLTIRPSCWYVAKVMRADPTASELLAR
ncbi:MAG: N-acetyltransferase [Alphaproteobacteria bacterium]|nr:N-acetyltransferase [Alphaproteobacteria bacterium]MCB9692486.1 N-acetyltransferase [Alphaproteobacteria bacterium]